MSLMLYGLNNCDTCKKALRALADANKDVTFVDIRVEADLKNKLPQWINAVGPDILVNKRSTSWRALSEDEREAVDKGKAVQMLQNHPTLIKRPVIETKDEVIVGWTSAVQSALL